MNEVPANQSRTGACLCGAVRFRTSGPLRGGTYCHCSQCRRQTGLYYAATNVALDSIAIEGENHVSWFKASDDARRGFCRTCGSALFWRAEGSDTISVLAGAFDQPSGLEGAMHVFTADKGDFYTLADGLPCYADSSRDATGS